MRKTDSEVLAHLRENVIDLNTHGLGSEVIYFYQGIQPDYHLKHG